MRVTVLIFLILAARMALADCPELLSRAPVARAPVFTPMRILDLKQFSSALLRQGVGIEIGPANSPICPGCLPLDRFRSSREVLGGIEGDPTLWVAARSGVIASARFLPFHDSSLSLVVTSNFPWFGRRAERGVIEPLLREYRRVLRDYGYLLLVTNSWDAPSRWSVHEQIARELGFHVEEVSLPAVHRHGLLLRR